MSWFKVLTNKLDVPAPAVFVETGTYMGDGIERVRYDFAHVHSIELKQEFADNAKARFKDVPNVFVHHGDSAEVLETLSQDIKQPAMFYLDAHYSGGATAFGKDDDKGCPILRELATLGARPYNDIIVIDDMRLMGKASMSGTPGDHIYPLTFFDFTHASVENIVKAYGKQCQMHYCDDIDRLVFYTK